MRKKLHIGVFQPPFGGLKGKVCTSSIHQWKVCDRLRIGNNKQFSWLLHPRNYEPKYLVRWRFVKRMDHFEAKY